MKRPMLAALAFVGAALPCILGFRSTGAGELSSVAVDHLGVSVNGLHEVWVAVLDERGRPVPGSRGTSSRRPSTTVPRKC